MFNEKSNEKAYVTYGKALLRGIILSIILILGAVAVFYFGNVSNNQLATITFVITILGICFSSIYGALKIGHRGYLHGAAIGVLYVVIISMIAVLIDKGQINVRSFLIKLIMAVVIGALSGMIGIILNKE